MISKVIYIDDGKSIGLTGEIISEDELFISIISREKLYRVGKKFIIAIKQDNSQQSAADDDSN